MKRMTWRGLLMPAVLVLGFGAMTLLAIVLLWQRARQAYLRSRMDRLEQRAMASGAVEGP